MCMYVTVCVDISIYIHIYIYIFLCFYILDVDAKTIYAWQYEHMGFVVVRFCMSDHA